KYLESITSVGPRPVGSAENEIMTVNFLLEQLEWVRNESVDGPKNITVEARKHNGSRGFNYYDQIINIVVRLEPRGGAQHWLTAILTVCPAVQVNTTVMFHSSIGGVS
ncbi:endoplasmic reticulum metallopeptidase 1, partial [Clarias magur]